jgi:hypothetical protein
LPDSTGTPFVFFILSILLAVSILSFLRDPNIKNINSNPQASESSLRQLIALFGYNVDMFTMDALLADRIAKEMKAHPQLAMAAIGATSSFNDETEERILNEQAARDIVQTELGLINSLTPEDLPNVQQLVTEGFDSFLSRRTLAFADNNMVNARAIIMADQMDQEEEEAAAVAALEEDEEEAMRVQLRTEQAGKKLDMVEVKTNFDPHSTSKSQNHNRSCPRRL